MSETPAPVADGSTVYVMPDPDGLGPTVDRAIAAADANVRHVVVCGARPGAGKSGAEAWAERRGAWFLTDSPHITRSAFRASLACDGRQVRVTRIEPWFGEHVEPGDAADAMRVIRHVTSAVGVRPFGTPAQTGRRMLAAMWDHAGAVWPTMPADVADLLRETSGQGRFQVFPAGGAGGAELVGVDARFQYGALAQLELPTGEPIELVGEPDEYAPAWCEVEFVPAGDGLGMLGVNGLGGWWWPIDGGPHRTWCSGAEVQAARRAGYRVTVRRAIVWPAKGRPLAPWARLLGKHRDRISTLPLGGGVQAAARAGVRAIVVQTIGSLHGRTGAPSVLCASAYKTEGASVPVSFDHPEWSTAIWSAARVRLSRVMIEQAAPVVACALDGFYCAGEPVLAPDDGGAGKWREVWRASSWSPIRNMADVYALKGTA